MHFTLAPSKQILSVNSGTSFRIFLEKSTTQTTIQTTDLTLELVVKQPLEVGALQDHQEALPQIRIQVAQVEVLEQVLTNLLKVAVEFTLTGFLIFRDR